MPIAQMLRLERSRSDDLVVALVAGGVGVGRAWRTFDQLPPDPSVDFFIESKNDALMTLLRTEGGYLDVPRRISALLISRLSPEFWVLASNAVWVLITALCSSLMYREARRAQLGFLPTVFLAVALPLAPAASESQLGHDSVIKWPLLLLSSVIWAIRPSLDNLRKTDIGILVITGFSNPMYTLLLIAIIASTNWRDTRTSRTRLITAAILCLPTVAQIWAWLASGQALQKYGDAAIRTPWDGMGGFWWINWLWSPAATGLALVALLLDRKTDNSKLGLRVRILSFGFVLWVGCFYIGGIGDRYFVVPQILGTLAAVLAICKLTRVEHLREIRRLPSLAGLSVLLVFFAASLQWFSPSAFLTSSEPWSKAVRNARIECVESELKSVAIPQSMNTVDFSCDLFHSRNNRD